MNDSTRRSDERAEEKENSNESDAELVEGLDYYLENGLLVFTARFLLRRGYCCESGCRHCPYSPLDQVEKDDYR